MRKAERSRRERAVYERYLARAPRDRIANEFAVSLSTVDRAIRKGRAGKLDPALSEDAAQAQLDRIESRLARLQEEAKSAESGAQRLRQLQLESELLALGSDVMIASGKLKASRMKSGIDPDFVWFVNRRLRLRLTGLGVEEPLIEAALEDVVRSYEEFSAAEPEAVT